MTLPVKELTTSSGLTGAFAAVNHSVFGSGTGAKLLGYLFGIDIILTLIGSGSVWILGSCRVQAVAALDGAAPRFLGKFSSQGTPSAMAWLSGIVGSAFVRRILDAADQSAAIDAVGELAAELALGVRG